MPRVFASISEDYVVVRGRQQKRFPRFMTDFF